METFEKIFTKILKNELLTALGCTEPACIAFCAAKMREALDREPEKIIVRCSGNLVKNAKGATVPNSGGMKGIEAAAVLGAIGGRKDKALEVLSDITETEVQYAKELIAKGICTVELLKKEDDNLQVIITGFADGHTAEAELRHTHTGIVRIEKDGETLFNADSIQKTVSDADTDSLAEELSVRRIIEFAETVDLEESGLKELMLRQVNYNLAVAEEGLNKPYGASVGRVMMDRFTNNVNVRAAAYAAAASDARMNGCEYAVVINSGSGNQGITVSMPVLQFANELGKSEDELARALIISNLTAIHIKCAYGRLSAFCGAVSAATGAGAAITWLHGGSYEAICGTIVNTLGTISGMVCDGAKSSCASKIAISVQAAIIADAMSMDQKKFTSGDGLIKENVENTIQIIGRMAAEGMIETDQTILKLMLE